MSVEDMAYLGEPDAGAYYAAQPLAGGGYRAVCVVDCEHFTAHLVGAKHASQEDASREAHDMAYEWCLDNGIDPNHED